MLPSLFLVVIADSKNVRAVGDQTAEVLDPRRVQAAQILVLSTALFLTILNGILGITAIMPLWATIVGTALWRFLMLARTSFLPTANGKKLDER